LGWQFAIKNGRKTHKDKGKMIMVFWAIRGCFFFVFIFIFISRVFFLLCRSGDHGEKEGGGLYMHRNYNSNS
jgi:hypothetical protein